MNLDLTVKVTDIVMIFAVLLGPIFAVCITIWAQQRNDKRSAKLQLFITLMSERKSVNVSNARANALNNIDVIFSDNEKVTSIWHKYYSLLSQSNHEERGHTWNELLSSMAKDLGIKTNILRNLAKRDCYIKVFPYDASFEDLKSFNPDVYFLSNVPGDPEPLESAQEVARQILIENKPLFGICLGHQIIGLANGIATYKMFNGHRGINHPVKNVITGKGEITSQNHGFAIVREELDKHPDFELTHEHLNDGTVAGMRMKSKNCFSVQYHPEASPGPHDSSYLFDQFIENIKSSMN